MWLPPDDIARQTDPSGLMEGLYVMVVGIFADALWLRARIVSLRYLPPTPIAVAGVNW